MLPTWGQAAGKLYGTCWLCGLDGVVERMIGGYLACATCRKETKRANYKQAGNTIAACMVEEKRSKDDA